MTYLNDLTSLTLEVYERYAREVVERFGFCPWARAAREGGSVALRVIFSANADDFAASLDALEALHGGGDEADIALFLYPLMGLDRLGFEDFVRRFRGMAEASERKLTAYAMAAFHPQASADLTHPDRLVPFVRRSPDPTVQLVRKSALSKIPGLTQGTAFLDVSQLSVDALRALTQAPEKPLRDRIGEQNLSTVKRVGASSIEGILDDIARAREAGHQRLLAVHGQRGPRR